MRGPGRPRLLGPFAVVWIGTECEAISYRFGRLKAHKRAYVEVDKQARAIEPQLGSVTENLHKFQAALSLVPLSARKRKSRPHHVVELIEDARSLTKVIGKGRQQGFRELVSAPLVRPKGIRSRILGIVAAKASKRYGIKIRPRMVDECWNTYRRRFLNKKGNFRP